MAVETRSRTVDALRQDLVAVLDEHGLNYSSFTITYSSKRRHGQIQFEESFEVKQERLPLNGQKGGEGDDN
jgi:hypothetical protein